MGSLSLPRKGSPCNVPRLPLLLPCSPWTVWGVTGMETQLPGRRVLTAHGCNHRDPRAVPHTSSSLPQQGPGKGGACVPLVLGTDRQQGTHETTQLAQGACGVAGSGVCGGAGLVKGFLVEA